MVMSDTEAPPTCCLNLLFERGSQLEESSPGLWGSEYGVLDSFQQTEMSKNLVAVFAPV